MEQRINKRFVAHINEGYLQRLFLKNNAITDTEKEEVKQLVIDEIRKFVRGEAEDNTLITYDYDDGTGNTHSTWWLELLDCEDDSLTEEKVYDFYQERSVTAGSRADQMVWMFVLMMTGVLISGHAYQTFAVCTALSAIYVLLSIAQAVWQTFSSWLFLHRIRHLKVMQDDYPSWVGGGAWLFFWLKMIAISSAVLYFVREIFF